MTPEAFQQSVVATPVTSRSSRSTCERPGRRRGEASVPRAGDTFLEFRTAQLRARSDSVIAGYKEPRQRSLQEQVDTSDRRVRPAVRRGPASPEPGRRRPHRALPAQRRDRHAAGAHREHLPAGRLPCSPPATSWTRRASCRSRVSSGRCSPSARDSSEGWRSACRRPVLRPDLRQAAAPRRGRPGARRPGPGQRPAVARGVTLPFLPPASPSEHLAADHSRLDVRAPRADEVPSA